MNSLSIISLTQALSCTCTSALLFVHNSCTTTSSPDVAVGWLALLLHIQKVLGSSLSTETCCPDGFSWFSLVPLATFWERILIWATTTTCNSHVTCVVAHALVDNQRTNQSSVPMF